MNKHSIGDLFYRTVAVMALCWLTLGVSPAAVVRATATVRYVNPSGLTSGTCDNWQNACELQYALDLVVSGEEVWIMQGIYKPTTTSVRAVSFPLKNGVGIYGGFAGTETARSQRDWAANLTALSGDIGVEGEISDNSYHVVNGSSTDNTAVLDGFTIAGGNADGSGPYSGGGGMCNFFGSPSLANLTFDSNSAGDGGGMYNYYSNHTLSNVVFIGNSATYEAYGHGGAIFNQNSTITLTAVTFNGNSALYGGGIYNGSSSPILAAVTFSDNLAINHGGGVYNYLSNAILTDVTFVSNSATTGGGMINNASNPILTAVTLSDNLAIDGGGGIFNYTSSPILANITFEGNSAESGGGMYNYTSSPSLANAIFDSNSAGEGGGVYNYNSSPSLVNVTFSSNSAANQGGGMYDDGSSPTVSNSILWGNNPDQVFNNASSHPTITYSDLQGGCPAESACTNIIDADPEFVDPPSGDLRLGRTSPAIDAGDNTRVPPDIPDLDGDGDTSEPLPYDLAGNPRFSDVPEILDTGNGAAPIVDMGAYERGINAPVAVDESYTTNEDTPLAIPVPGVLGNDTDLDGDPLTAILESDPAHGLLTLDPDGSFVYTPTLSYHGSDSFTYRASDGGLDSNESTVTILVNAKPVVQAGPNQATDEGQQVAFAGSFTDPENHTTNNLAAVTILWDFGDGFTATDTLTPTHTYADNGAFTVTLTVTDSLGASGSASLLVAVANVAPSLPMLPDLSIIPGETVTLTIIFTDPGLLDTHTVVIEWLPGQTQELDLAAGVLAFTVSREFPQEGTYPVTVTVMDKDGSSASRSFTVFVLFYRIFLPSIFR